ncbi:RNA polymerase sigma-70 factor [Paenibacillus silviterrae]|uniref:RNA polymerase sigma-70 factor n=1 Tax=Paenibacillus silviterrae TaxID=3242194 RepID=UPI0025438677|nr:RNA polymerase sigma-70 factor [Paenibacillus chinjuensis]
MQIDQLYETYRPLLFSIAYRLLGSISDAEDTVQETFLAWSERTKQTAAVQGEPVTHIKAYLCRILTNHCADRIRKLRRQRESYVGPWLPEPLTNAGPEDACIRKDTIHTAYLLLLQQLNAAERTVFVLREAFDFSYDEIAEITGKSTANCRQIYRRARQGMPAREEQDVKPPDMKDNERARSILLEFGQALERGNVPKVLQMLTQDAVLVSDGGGKVNAALKPILTPERIVAFIIGTVSKLPEGMQVKSDQVNGLPGLVYTLEDRVLYVVSFALEGERISGIYLVSNPDKLERLNS